MKYRREFNRLLGNFLTSCKALEAISNKKLSNVAGRKSRPLAKHKSLRRKALKTSRNFRLMEAIRNLQQHAGLVVAGASPQIVRVDGSLNSPIAYSSVVTIDKAELTMDAKFRTELASDLAQLPTKINGVPEIAEYLETVSSIHCEVRRSLASRVRRWEAALDTVHKRLQQNNSNVDWSGFVPVSIYVFPNASMLGPLREEYIGMEIFEYRKDLERKNKQLSNLKKSYVTGQKL